MNEYSSNTKRVAEKLAGMTEACANVHDDERLSELFALAPDRATHIWGGEYYCYPKQGVLEVWKKNCSKWVVSPYCRSDIRDAIQEGGAAEIPPRERELNNLADKNSEWHEGDDSYICEDGSFIDEQEWKSRREQRIAAGLIYVNDTDVVDMQDSQQDEFKREHRYWVFKRKHLSNEDDTKVANLFSDILEKNPKVGVDCVVVESDWPNYYSVWADIEAISNGTYDQGGSKEQSQEWDGNGLPPVGAECEWLSYRSNCWTITKVIAYDDLGQVWLQGEGVVDVDRAGDHFRPIKSAEKKRRDERQCWIDMAIAKAEQAGAECDVTFAGAIYDWLVSIDKLKED